MTEETYDYPAPASSSGPAAGSVAEYVDAFGRRTHGYVVETVTPEDGDAFVRVIPLPEPVGQPLEAFQLED